MKRNGKRKAKKFRASAKLAREAETRAVARACEVARFLAPLPVGAQRTKQAQHGPALPVEMIGSALARSRGILYRAIEYIRANGYPQYSMSALRERIAQDTRLQEIAEESRMGLVCDAVDALHEAVLSGADWAIRQVLNSPLANDLQLGQPSAKVAIDARSISVNDSGVFDNIDLQQRLARLGNALQGLANGGGNGGAPAMPAPAVALPCPSMDAAPLAMPQAAPEAVEDSAPIPSPGTPSQGAQGGQGAPFSPCSATSHNLSYVSKSAITEPTDTPEAGAEAVPEAAPDAGAKAPRKNGRSHRAPRVAKVAAESGAPRKRGRPRGSRDSGRKRGRNPGRGKNRATGGGL